MNSYKFTVKNLSAPMRVDSYLAIQLDAFSRAQIQQKIKEHCMTINGNNVCKTRTLVNNEDQIEITITLEAEESWKPQKKDIDIVFEDNDLMVINKSAGDVVHPGSGNLDHTILNGLIHYNPALSSLPRAGIIHRLDKDTTGLMIIAKQPESFQRLTQLLANRDIHRRYEAIVHRKILANGVVDQPIGRHPTKRTQMTVRTDGKPAQTFYDVIENYSNHSHIRCKLVTGRTHQIRVHMKYIKHPILGDPIYHGGYHTAQLQSDPSLQKLLQTLNRQALHARHLALQHPITHEPLHFSVPVPKDMQVIIDYLQHSNQDE